MKVLNRRKQMVALVCGLLGCLCFGAGDWLMMYGDPTYTGSVYWLTEGVARIAPWRNTLAMVLSFPGIVLYGTALFSLESFIHGDRHKRTYHYLTIYGLTPWLCLHLFYEMTLFAFGWMRTGGFADMADAVCTAMVAHFGWLPLVSEVLMVPPFLYWFYLQLTGKTAFPKGMACTNILILYGVLYATKSLLPVSAFRMGFTNGLMSESMLVWFLVMLGWLVFRGFTEKEEKPKRKHSHLSIYGVGPVFCVTIIVLTVAGVISSDGLLASGRYTVLYASINAVAILFLILGVLLWGKAVFQSKIDDGILHNRLVTTGVYAWVRNPIYSAFLFACTGVLLLTHNLWLLLLPPCYWGFLTILVKYTEEQWLRNLYGMEYIAYCRRTNRCVPWLPRKEKNK